MRRPIPVLAGSPAELSSEKSECGPLPEGAFDSTDLAEPSTSEREEGAFFGGGTVELRTEKDGVSRERSACMRVPISQLACTRSARSHAGRKKLDTPVLRRGREVGLDLLHLVV
jgi:hypothetical protein